MQELNALDQFEGGYQKEEKTVMVEGLGEVAAVAYIKEDLQYTQPPSVAYMRAIREM